MTDVLDGVLDEAGAQLDEAVDLRRRIHERPELGLDLPGTQATVLEALDGLPLTVTTGTTSSSVVAVLDGDEPGPTVLLRGDMDALPMHEDTDLEFASRVDGAMHACGHDTHVAMLAGAAKLLTARRGRAAPAGWPSCSSPARRATTAPGTCSTTGLLATAADGPSRCRWPSPSTRPHHPLRDGGLQGPGAHGVGRRVQHHGAGPGWARLDAAPRERPDPDRLRDGGGLPGHGHPPGRRLRPRGGHRGQDPGGHHHQRDPGDGELQGTVRTVSEKARATRCWPTSNGWPRASRRPTVPPPRSRSRPATP